MERLLKSIADAQKSGAAQHDAVGMVFHNGFLRLLQEPRQQQI